MEIVYKIGETENPGSRVVRIVHISDTHMQHDAFMAKIPNGDILIHSGDFGSFNFKRHFHRNSDFYSQILEINDFFGKLPHKWKIFVAGNHETNFPRKNKRKIDRVLKNGIYLQDSFVIIEGIKIYGTPWNNYRLYSFADAFALSPAELQKKWAIIPDDTDVLVTHLPPGGVLDLASVTPWKKLWRNNNETCELCESHPSSGAFIREHWGCVHLKNSVIHKR